MVEKGVNGCEEHDDLPFFALSRRAQSVSDPMSGATELEERDVGCSSRRRVISIDVYGMRTVLCNMEIHQVGEEEGSVQRSERSHAMKSLDWASVEMSMIPVGGL